MNRLVKPALFLLASCGAAWAAVQAIGPGYDPRDALKGPAYPWLAFGCASLLLVFASLTGASLVEATCWLPLQKKYGRPIPRLLKMMGVTAIALLVFAGVVELLYRKSITTLWAASGFAGLGLVLGLKDLLRDVFAGVLLNLEQPFKIHDKIRVLATNLAEIEGEVLDIDWRSTRLRTLEGDLVVIPNSIIGGAALLNWTQTSRLEHDQISLSLEPKAPVEWVRKILAAAVSGSGVALHHPAPAVVVSALHSWGVEYTVEFHFDSTKITRALARDRAITAVLEQIRREGIELASQKHEILMVQEPPSAKRH